MSFKNAEVKLLDTEAGADFLGHYAQIQKRFKDSGGETHGYSFICQVFAHASKHNHFFLSGTILNPEESAEFAAILAKREGNKK